MTSATVRIRLYRRKDADRVPAFAVPSGIRDVLTSRYEYVVAEKDIVPDLTDTLRNCDTCSKWCPPYVLHACSNLSPLTPH